MEVFDLLSLANRAFALVLFLKLGLPGSWILDPSRLWPSLLTVFWSRIKDPFSTSALADLLNAGDAGLRRF
ncbi:hypothetical protein CROQUDRAFT_88674 [Cronartium quercuum f. sp. fusiforme G11]|uniref:Uncharacterized protein n=1 Tax=Cronartium quercuum f. sp. fusiforme G11 TaxID=708437 RepID=A0A9P6NUL5_9BASI|nr:hypothetical protein CROQUDRAFT_88674 [Cronartium quercuum f. sp. fusiforme G11]